MMVAVLLAIGPAVAPGNAQDASGGAVAMIAAGGSHTCAIEVDGPAWCWGSGGSGQLGDGVDREFPHESRVPIQVAVSGPRLEAIVAGSRHTCGVDAAGDAWCWGRGVEGVLGNGANDDRSTPVKVAAGSTTFAPEIVAGGGGAAFSHTCALDTDGGAHCWGYNSHGQLGTGTGSMDVLPDHNSPVRVQAPGVVFTALAAGSEGGPGHTCGLDTDGRAWCWGDNHNGQLAAPPPDPHFPDAHLASTDVPQPVQVPAETTFTAITAGGLGFGFTCAIDTDGAGWCWGSNDAGQLGTSLDGYSNVPVLVDVPDDVELVAMDAGLEHTCAVDTDGAAWCWGGNEYGQRGDGTTDGGPTPTRVAAPSGVRFTTISAGGTYIQGLGHTCALDTDGNPWCWGTNSSGAVTGDDYDPVVRPRQVLGLGAAADAGIDRLAGPGRVETAAVIAAAWASPPVPRVYVATASNFPDALAVGPRAASEGSPILLVSDDLADSTVEQLERLVPPEVVLLGGTGAISPVVEQALRDRFPDVAVRRISGADRFATAAEIATEAHPNGASTVYVATGASFPDALAGGPAAARDDAPLLLVERDVVPAATATALHRLDPNRVVVLGGTGVVSEGVASELASVTGVFVERLAGDDRYGTAAAITQTFQGPKPVVVATGQSFPDALAGVPAAVAFDAVLLLVESQAIPLDTELELARLQPDAITVLGGHNAVGRVLEGQLAQHVVR